jgi:valyl-tRNA synthetase
MSTTELPKTYDPSAVESEAYRVWMEEKAFVADPGAPGEPFSIVIPPPNVTGALHLGHAINNTLQDILTRRARMQGKNAVWIPGIDHAGIATQAVVEKQLKEKENKTRHDVGREGLVQRIWEWKQQYGDRIIEQLKAMGCSADWSRTRFTLDEGLARAVRQTFFKLFKDGLIYRGKRLVNWDVHLQTSISDDEIYHETVKTSLWHIKYPIENANGDTGVPPVRGAPGVSEIRTEESGSIQHGRDARVTDDRPRFMVVATTRPETMLGDTAVAVHSEDPRWNWAIGKSVRLPLLNRLIPIVADDILVDPKFGSGVVKVTPAHDPNDYAVWQRHQGKADPIDLINILNPNGTLNENAGPYAGMKRDAARKKVVEDLTAQGLLVKEEPHEAQVGHSDRSKTAVEPYLSDQWFVKMAPLAEPALEVVRKGKVKFFPERHAQQYLSWLGEKRDWPISRQLWWGHRIPIWHRHIGSKADDEEWNAVFHWSDVDEMVYDNPEWAAQIVDASTGERLQFSENDIGEIDKYRGRDLHVYVCKRRGDWNVEHEKSLECAGFVQDPDVLDTWFSSALWPHSTLGWPDETPDLRKWYPTSVLLTGRDIITLWVARMVMTGLYNMGDVPFHHVAINPTILDGKGERMSKSKGNGVDPLDVIATHGADALRFTLATMATETQDVRMPVKKDAQGRNISEKFDLGRNFANKLWNAARFVISNLESQTPEPVDEQKWSMADRWIVSRFNRTVEEANTALTNYRFDLYAKACYDFFWRDFCDWYVEAVKPAMKDPARAGQTANVVAAVLDGALRLMHPVIPFITETIWWKLNEVRPGARTLPGRIEGSDSPRLVKASWPTVGDFSQAAEHIFPRLQEIVGAIRQVRNEHKVDPRKSVTVSILAPGDSARQIQSNREMIEMLAVCTIKDVSGDLPPVPNAARASAAGCEIFVEGVVDEGAEKQRQAKRREELTRQITAMRGRLGNEAYTAKAPPHLVKQTQDQLAEAEAELAKLG